MLQGGMPQVNVANSIYGTEFMVVEIDPRGASQGFQPRERTGALQLQICKSVLRATTAQKSPVGVEAAKAASHPCRDFKSQT